MRDKKGGEILWGLRDFDFLCVWIYFFREMDWGVRVAAGELDNKLFAIR